MKFKKGDRVRHLMCNQDEIIEGFNARGWIKGRYCETGDLSSIFAPPESYRLIKEGKGMPIKEKIENINEDTTIKELDDLIVEILPELPSNCIPHIKIRMNQSAPDAGYIEASVNGRNEQFGYCDQCDKLQALKNALMWLAEKSGKLKDNKKEVEELKKEFNLYEARMQKISVKIERLEE
ncbi:hypothetical protein LCGC14_0398850 [marine sediment metagenome]|uniref:Uncharacterized protein n=1 Tax=marine sediment metagenome TaxID=412755 RepID=A0A0F9T2U2_9ZZZZ|nr:hypothetical protein [Candidatus Aminicenantes bacterium]